MASSIDYSSNLQNACKLLREAQQSGAGLLIVSGAGLSVQSGVPVFRMADGSMSADFVKFLGDYNDARKKHGLEEASSWFSFSVPEMFRKETAKEAWQYWRWRMLRARVQPADDYQLLNKLIASFGMERVFVVTSNCDRLHISAGLPEDNIFEIHGSLGYLQCSEPCHMSLYSVDDTFLQRLEEDSEWVPSCPECHKRCLRPNVMIFMDHTLVERRLDEQEQKFKQFKSNFLNPRSNTLSTSESSPPSAVVLEIGAGRVVSSIRYHGESLGLVEGNGGLIRINPSTVECEQMEISVFGTYTEMKNEDKDADDARREQVKYFPLDRKANDALSAICTELNL